MLVFCFTMYNVCEGVQYRMKETLCSASFSPYSTPSARTVHLRPVLYTLSPCCTPSARTIYPKPVRYTLSPHCTYFIQGVFKLAINLSFCGIKMQWRGGRGGGGGRQEATAPIDNFLGDPKSKRGAKIRNCQCQILYKICQVRLVNKFKDIVVILAFPQLFS